MNWKSRKIWFSAIAVIALMALLIFGAPMLSPSSRQGSTYSREPNGYGAWYAYMQQQGVTVQRWQRPLSELFEPLDRPNRPKGSPLEKLPKKGVQQISWRSGLNSDLNPDLNLVQAVAKKPTFPLTMIRVHNGIAANAFKDFNPNWFSDGNVLVLIGDRAPTTDAPFTSQMDSAVGKVKIETTRRWIGVERENNDSKSNIVPQRKGLRLGDRKGSVVWEEPINEGKIIHISTPFLAANAYQDEPGNFKYLQKLVTAPGNPIWVDEYLHGHIDPAGKSALGKEDESTGRSRLGLLRYLANTPLSLVLLQSIVILGVMIVGLNQRMGRAIAVKAPTVDNSEAYIKALAGVLEKANCTDFVVETIGKAEQVAIQRSLGLGVDPVEVTMIVTAWQQQTGQPAAEMEQVLRLPMQLRSRGSSAVEQVEQVEQPNSMNLSMNSQSRTSPAQLLTWLTRLQNIRAKLPR